MPALRAILHFTTTVAFFLVIIRSASASTAEQDFGVATSHYQAGRWQFAADEFDHFRQRHPHHPQAADAEFFQAESLVQLNRLEAACGCYQEFLLAHHRHPMAPRALFRWGECEYRLGNAADALRLLQQFARQQPDHELNAYALPYLGQLLAASNETMQADGILHRAIERYPRGPLADECHLQLAILYYREQRLEAALAELGHLRDDFPDSKRQAHALYWQGAILLAQGEYESAAEAFERVLQAPTAEDVHAAAGFFRGECLRCLKQWDAAEDQFRWVVDAGAAQEWVAASSLGLIRLGVEQDDWERAQGWISQVQERFPQSEFAQQARQLGAQLLIQRQQYVAAIAELELLTEVTVERTGAPAHRLERFHVAYLLAVAYLGNQQPAQALGALLPVPREDLSATLRTQFDLVESLAWTDLEAYAQAISLLQETLQRAPGDAHSDRCRLQLVRCLIADDRFPAAADVLASWPTSAASASTRRAAISELAESAFAQADYERAAHWFQDLADQSVDDAGLAGAVSGLAWCHWKQGNRDAAAEHLRRLVQDFPDDRRAPEARFLLARLLEQAGEEDEALAVYRQAAERSTDAGQTETARLRMAQLLERKGDYEAALHELNAILENARDPVHRDQVHYLRGWIFRHRRDSASSVVEFQTVHDDYPESDCWADATYRLAESAYQAERWNDATTLLDELIATEQAASVFHFAPFALFLQGRIAIAEKDWAGAAARMQQILTEAPSAELARDARLWLAEANYRLADYLAAEEQFAIVADEAGSLQEPWNAIVPLRRAQILAAERKWPEALAAAQAILDNHSDAQRRFEAEFVAGRALMGLARLDDARAAFQRVVDDPNASASETAAMAQYMIGETHRHQKQYMDAIRAYLRLDLLYDHPPSRAAALLEAGGCYESLQQIDEARRLYQQLLAQFPESDQRCVAQQRLQRLQSESDRLTVTNSPNRR